MARPAGLGHRSPAAPLSLKPCAGREAGNAGRHCVAAPQFFAAARSFRIASLSCTLNEIEPQDSL